MFLLTVAAVSAISVSICLSGRPTAALADGTAVALRAAGAAGRGWGVLCARTSEVVLAKARARVIRCVYFMAFLLRPGPPYPAGGSSTTKFPGQAGFAWTCALRLCC